MSTTGAKKAVILVGHGGIPHDVPREEVVKLKRLEGLRRAAGTPPTAEELELDRRIRQWPRTPESDPYQAGLETLASRLRPLLDGALFGIAYNEFCAPTLEEAVANLVAAGATDITVVSSMATPGGSHSEIEIPEVIEQLKHQLPHITIRYAWPFDLGLVARTIADQIKRFW